MPRQGKYIYNCLMSKADLGLNPEEHLEQSQHPFIFDT